MLQAGACSANTYERVERVGNGTSDVNLSETSSRSNLSTNEETISLGTRLGVEKEEATDGRSVPFKMLS